MPERPSLSNGYLWVCHVALPVAKAQRLQQQLDDIRCELRVLDFPEPGNPSAGQTVQLWVHPEDDARACAIVGSILAES